MNEIPTPTCKIVPYPVSFQKGQDEIARSGFIDKDQEKTKEEYKQKIITIQYTEYRRKTGQ